MHHLCVALVLHIINRNNMLQVSFESLFLGKTDELLKIMEDSFPELGLNRSDCMEMSWIGSVLYFSEYSEGTTIEALRDRTPQEKISFKGSSDYVKQPLPEAIWEELWELCLEEENSLLILDPYGGRMNEISESEIPFPHRKEICLIFSIKSHGMMKELGHQKGI